MILVLLKMFDSNLEDFVILKPLEPYLEEFFPGLPVSSNLERTPSVVPPLGIDTLVIGSNTAECSGVTTDRAVIYIDDKAVDGLAGGDVSGRRPDEADRAVLGTLIQLQSSSGVREEAR